MSKIHDKNPELIEQGKRICQAMRDLPEPLDIPKLAERVGVSYVYMNDIAAGRKDPALKTFVKIAEVLHISLDYLRYGTADSGEIAKMYESLNDEWKNFVFKMLLEAEKCSKGHS